MMSSPTPHEAGSPAETAWSAGDHNPDRANSLCSRAVMAWRITALAFGALIYLPSIALALLLPDASAVVRFSLFAVAVMSVIFGIVMPKLRYRAWRYRLGTYAIALERGVVVKRTTCVPYHRVQHIDVSAGITDRALGITSLKLHTAASGTDAILPALTVETAETVRQFVLQRTDRDPGV